MKLKVFVKQRTSRLSDEAAERVRKFLPSIHLFLLQRLYCILYFPAQTFPSYSCHGSHSFTLEFIASFSFIVTTYIHRLANTHTSTQVHM